MGITLEQQMNESNKIDIDYFLSKSQYGMEYKLVSYLKNDIFKTLLVTTKKTKEFESGIPFVIKLFPIQNERIYLKYSQEFLDIKRNYSKIESTPNILPIIKIEQLKEANAGIVIRQYIKYNLKQAMYYLTCSSDIEKKWICFQLLQGLKQMHLKGKCHGDIKPENILMTSKFSVFISDISVYKPVYLIIENLQLYNDFFYCNSVDRACYLAPERFVHNLEGADKNKIDQLTKEMDIFSLGVVFAEIFLDRQNLFTQNDIMNYKNKKIDLKIKLNDIKDTNLQKVIKDMIALEPKKRIGLSDLIDFFVRSICPSPITTFIFHINLMIINYGYYKNDLLAALLHKHFIQIWKCLCCNDKALEKLEIPKLKKKLNKYLILDLLNNKYNIYKIANNTILPLAFVSNEESNNKEIFIETEINIFDEMNNINSKRECSIIIIKYLISCLENLKYISTYFSIFEMIYNLSQILIKDKNPNVIIDLIVPNYIDLFKLNNSKLSIEVYNCIIDILQLINYDELILSKIDYNYFNNYVFEEIYKLYLNTEILELKCAIISRLDEIIELENNFLSAYLNTYNSIINKEKNKDKKNFMDIQEDMLFKTYINDKRIKETKVENKNLKDTIDFNFVRDSYFNDLSSFKKKLKDIVKKTLEEADNTNDSLKLLIIQKYREICLFCGNYEENEQLFNHLFMLFNQNNYYIQKEIIKLFPSLILLFGNKLFYDYFTFFVNSSCQKKNSELIIMEIIDALILLSKMDILYHVNGYSQNYKILKCYNLLIPYIVHPNYLLRNKLISLINQKTPDECCQKTSELYISLNKNIKNILQENNGSIVIINAINKETNNQINNYYKIPREIFLLYKYNIDCTYFNTNYLGKENLLSGITKIKKEHFINKIKNDDILRNNLGLNRKEDILNIDQKSFLKTVKHQFTEMIKKEGIYTDKNSSFVQQNFINKLTILLNEINSMKENKNFMSIWYNACKKGNIYYSRILYLLKVLNCQLDIKNVVTNNLALASNDNFRKDKYFKDWNVLSDVDSSQFQSINPMNYSIKENKDDKIAKFCHELNLNSGESIVKLIPVNCFFTNFSRNFFVSISDEGVVRLHMIENEINFKDIYTIKNRVQYKIKLEDNILKANNISHVESRKKIIIIIAIKYKLEVITFELNDEKYDVNIDDVKDSCEVNNMECKSSKEIICIENNIKSDKNFLVLGNSDNSISFYNYIDNSIDYINNCSHFSPSYGSITLIISLKLSNEILFSTSNGFIISYDYNLRLFKNVYSFSKRRRIKQIVEYVPNFGTENKESKINLKDKYIFILTNDDQITLWNLSLSNPIIIYELIKVKEIQDSKKIKKEDIVIPKMEKKYLKEENYSSYSGNDFILDNQIIKINNDYKWDIKTSSTVIFIGEKQGICIKLDFSNDILEQIKNKKVKNNDFNKKIFFDNKKKLMVEKNYSKYLKEEGVYVNKFNYCIKNKDEKNIKIEWNEIKEMNDLIILRDCFSENKFIIGGFSNGIIKLWII